MDICSKLYDFYFMAPSSPPLSVDINGLDDKSKNTTAQIFPSKPWPSYETMKTLKAQQINS